MVNAVISFLIITGAFFILVAALGILKFKDLYGRLHAVTKASALGIIIIVIGVSIFFNMPSVYIKGIFIIFFTCLTVPLTAHAIVKSFKNDDKTDTDKIQKQ
jgi:multicomponent Na+:H+ antiporter subunit G